VHELWWRLEQRVTADRLYGDVQQVVVANQYFGGFTTEPDLQLAA